MRKFGTVCVNRWWNASVLGIDQRDRNDPRSSRIGYRVDGAHQHCSTQQSNSLLNTIPISLTNPSNSSSSHLAHLLSSCSPFSGHTLPTGHLPVSPFSEDP